MIESLFSAQILVHLALLFYGVGFMIRDELWLRILILIGTGFYILYYFYISDAPLWDAIFASTILGIINIVLVIIIIRERTLLAMSQEEASLFDTFKTLTPGQFRKLMAIGQWHTVGERVVLTEQGKVPGSLFFVLSGELQATKNRESFQLKGKKFIGEIAYLTNLGASATIAAQPNTIYIEWKTADIDRLKRKSQAFENAFTALFNQDLAMKVAKSVGRAGE